MGFILCKITGTSCSVIHEIGWNESESGLCLWKYHLVYTMIRGFFSVSKLYENDLFDGENDKRTDYSFRSFGFVLFCTQGGFL